MNINDVVVYLDTKGVEHNGLVKDVNQLHDGYLSLSYQDVEGRSIDVYDVPHFTHPSREETNPDLPTFHLHCWKNRGEDHTPIPKDHPMFDHPFEPITKDDDGRRVPKPRPMYDAVIAEHMASKLPSAADLDAAVANAAAEQNAKDATSGEPATLPTETQIDNVTIIDAPRPE